MRHPMSLKARRELLASTAARYQQASKKEKQVILDEFTISSGYHRKYAIWLLKHYHLDQHHKQKQNRKPRGRKYNTEVQAALVVVWEAANRICSKRLVPFLPEMVEVLETYGHLSVSDEVRECLLSISASTVDRLLYKIRCGGRASAIETTKPGALLKSQVSIRTFADWDDDRPGFLEADLVAHCGSYVGGHFLHTLVMTDVATGWTEFAALLFRDQETVLPAIRHIQKQIPFALLGLDTDNGSEFLNYLLLQYCFDEEITFTRSRPYKKNDQCHVEEKNGSIIRKFIGYDRFEGIQPCQILSALYEQLRLYVNFFQPSLKLLSKTRQGSRVIKKYDQAQTPHQRVLASKSVPQASKQQLTEQYGELDPVHLLRSIETLQDQLWRLAYVERDMLIKTNSQNGSQPKKSSQSTMHAFVPDQKNASLSSPKLERTDRMYRRTTKKRRNGQIKRWWRTRKDPFADVWDEVEQKLECSPYTNAKALFKQLQQKYPGEFQDGQLRTLQRRVKAWRIEQANQQIDDDRITENPYSIPGNGKSG